MHFSTSHLLQSSSLKRLWIGSSMRSSPNSITSDRRCTNVTPMSCAGTLPVRALRVGEAHEKYVRRWMSRVAISSCVTAFICRPITACCTTIGFRCVTSRSFGDTHRKAVLSLIHVDALRSREALDPRFNRAGRHEVEVEHPWGVGVGLVNIHSFPNRTFPNLPAFLTNLPPTLRYSASS